MTDSYARLMDMLEQGGARYRLIDHAPEGRTDAASRLRGHPLSQAAKCLVLRVKSERYAVGVVPGDLRIDPGAVQALYGATHVGLAPADAAQAVTGCVTGAIVPFSPAPDTIDLLVDPSLLVHEEVFFNAARLDRSLVLRTDDYVNLAKPRIEPIAQRRRG